MRVAKKMIAMGVILISSQWTWAQYAQSSYAPQDEVLQLDLPEEYYLQNAVDVINRIQLGYNSSYTLGKVAVADACVDFMDKDQALSALGNGIYKNLVTKSKTDYAHLFKGGDINNACPRYGRMSDRQKGLVWVFILTMVSHFESSCKLGAAAKGPNGTAQGLYQLHKGKEAGYTDSKNACPKNASLDRIQSSKCTLAMLDDQLEKTGGKLFAPGSYWDVLRPQGKARRAKQIASAIRNSALCSPTAF